MNAWGGLDPDVVEAASLAHDLGHPPFGHDGEEVISELLDSCDRDGFEGNAQSFRIVTRLATHTDNTAAPTDEVGLNLTRATLNAILKYPWLRSEPGKPRDKWGAYGADRTRFEWARSGWSDGLCSLESRLMDWADDVTYAVHDLEDFYRAGLIPLHLLSLNPAEGKRFIEAAMARNEGLLEDGRESKDLESALRAALGPFRFLDALYDGSRKQRGIMNACCLVSHNSIHYRGFGADL